MRNITITLILSITLPLAARALERTTLLPPETQAYVRISDTTNFWAGIKQSPLGKLWADQQIQDFLGRPGPDVWKELLFEEESDAETEIMAEQLMMLRGEVILAFNPDEEEPCIIAAMTEDDFLRSLELDEKMREMGDDSMEILKSSFQDVQIIQHINNGGTENEYSSWQTQVGTTFVMGYEKEWIEQCIVRLKKEPADEPKGHPACRLNIPISTLLRQVLEEEEADRSDSSDDIDTELMFDALGLMGVDNFSIDVELRDTEMVADSYLRVSDLNKGLFTIFDPTPSELPSVDFIPEIMASIEVGRFNLLRFWQEIPTVLETAMPEAKPQFDMVLAVIQQQAGINLEQDLLTHLGTEYVSFSVAESNLQTSVMAIELKDAMAFKTGLETVIAAPALQPQVAAGLEIEQFLDHTIYSVKDADPEEALAFGVMGSYLLYGNPGGLRQVIRNQNSGRDTTGSYENSPLVKGLRKHVPPKAFGFGAIDWKQYMTVLLDDMSEQEYLSIMQESWAKSGSPFPPPDFDKLPPTDHIASFFNTSYQYAEATRDGLHQRIILRY